MNQKTTVILSLLVALAGVAVYFAQVSSVRTPPADLGPRSLFEPKPTDITRLELAAAGKPAVVFEKKNDAWQLIEPTAGAADAARVSGEIERLTGLQTSRSYGKDDKDRPSEDLTRLQEPAFVAKLTSKEGKATTIRVGKPVLMARETYLQLEGDERLYIVKGDLSTEMHADLDWFRDLRVANFEAASAVRLSIGAKQPIVLAKSDGSKWTIESPLRARADAAAVQDVLTALSSARAVKYVSDKGENAARYGLDKPRLTVSVDVEKKTPRTPPPGSTQPASQPEFDVEKSTYTVQLGTSYETNVYARLEGTRQGGVFTLPQSTADRLSADLNKLRDKRLVSADMNKTSKLKISGPAGEVELEKRDGLWRINRPEMPDAARAEFAAVDDVLKTLRDLKANAFEDADAGLTPAYGFEKGTKVELCAEGEVDPVQLTVGAATRGGTGVYVRNDRDQSIAVVRSEAAAALQVSPTAFIDRVMLTLNRDQVDQVELTRSGMTRTLSKTAGEWRLSAPLDAPTEPQVITDLLADLSALHARRIVGTAADLAKFGLDQPVVKVGVRVQAPAPPAASQPAASQPGSAPASQAAPPPPPPESHVLVASRKDGKAYVFVEGGSKIAEVDDKIVRDLTAEPHQHKVATMDTSQLAAIELKYPDDRTMLFEKKGADWTLEGEPGFKADEVKLRPIADALRDLQTDEFAAYRSDKFADFGLTAPAIAVTIRTEHDSKQLLIAAQGPAGDASGRRYATIAGSGKVFLIGVIDVKKFEKTLKDLEKAG